MARQPFSGADIDHAISNVRRTLERMDSDLAAGSWLAGANFSLADIHLSPYIVRIGDHVDRGVRLQDYR